MFFFFHVGKETEQKCSSIILKQFIRIFSAFNLFFSFPIVISTSNQNAEFIVCMLWLEQKLEAFTQFNESIAKNTKASVT